MVPRVAWSNTLVPIKRTAVHISMGIPDVPTMEAMTVANFLLVRI